MYLIKSAIEMIFRLCFFANSNSVFPLAIVPSSANISHITPLGLSPASLARSMLASVWPALLKTPPSFPTIGKMCPGLAKSLSFDFSSMMTLMVSNLSKAEIPVVVFFEASTLIVKFVS